MAGGRGSEDILHELRRRGYRWTRPRQAVARVLAGAHDWLTPEEVHARARRQWPRLGLVSVYRTLGLLADLGFARRVHLEDGCHGYALSSLEHGHYLICRRCQQVLEFPGCDLQPLLRRVARRTGFVIQQHMLELIGVCPECQAAVGIEE
jgi:Fe2+ or Zn2+ uptake regulation protein